MIFKMYLKMLYNLPEINKINYKSINSFNICEKNLNYKMNKIRENIIILHQPKRKMRQDCYKNIIILIFLY